MTEILRYLFFEILLLVLTLMFIERWNRNLYAYIVMIWRYNILMLDRGPMAKQDYNFLNKRLRYLKKENKRVYEQNLIEQMLEEITSFKYKFTGKNKRKIKYKGEALDSGKRKKFSTFS